MIITDFWLENCGFKIYSEFRTKDPFTLILVRDGLYRLQGNTLTLTSREQVAALYKVVDVVLPITQRTLWTKDTVPRDAWFRRKDSPYLETTLTTVTDRYVVTQQTQITWEDLAEDWEYLCDDAGYWRPCHLH